ncbi:uncharacterized protein N7469_007879 [Penicillium citrinum]|uniref:Zn(2)-C6 fungal-type domain-containing protein n=1 Tax=Penicillium citrinum TaxID=5077 RepID=A0A9W9TIT3_PENCI|nr:uncharacterized protein N7469_007879 [Penicillium citrinum]KAJ5224376.1 hypothetical protein N7469_007879 [Penicillium citrinum]
MVELSGARMPKACRMCAKAKVRCEPESDSTCKRCCRLGKQCSGQVPGAQRRPPSAKRNAEISVLEAKVDRMAALLAASTSSVFNPSELGTSVGESSNRLYAGIPTASTEDEGDIILRIFNTQMVHLFPFVVIAPHVTAEQLRQDKPFLFLNISMVACQKSSQQRELYRIIKEYVAEHIVLQNERSLDLLQGLLVFLAWFISHPPAPCQTSETLPDLTVQQAAKGPAQLDAFTHLALAQLTSLRLAHGSNSPKKLSKPLSYVGKMDALIDSTQARTLEERRAYLGCYYLTVMMSSCVRDMEPLRFTKYTEECCNTVSLVPEFPTDTLLVPLVRTAHLADKIVQTICSDDFDLPGLYSTPLGLSIRGFEAELRRLKASFPCEPPYSSILHFHYDTLEILLYEIALSEEFSDFQCGSYTVSRLDILFRCLQATRSFFENFFSLPSHYFLFTPFTTLCQFGHAIVALSRLSLFQSDSGWDVSYVQRTIDYDQTIDCMVHKLEEARQFTESGLDISSRAELPEVFGRLTSRMRLMKEIHHQKKEALEKSRLQGTDDPPNFDSLLDISFDASFPWDDLMAFGEGIEMPENS